MRLSSRCFLPAAKISKTLRGASCSLSSAGVSARAELTWASVGADAVTMAGAEGGVVGASCSGENE
jgi:hypothetical protein